MKSSQLVTLLALALTTFVLPAQEAPQAVEEEHASFRVHPEQTYQTIAGFGAGLTDMSALEPAELARANRLLYTEDGVRLNIARVVVPPTVDPLAEPSADGRFHHDWDADQWVQRTLLELKRIPDLKNMTFYAVPFTPPAQWKDNQQITMGGSLLREHYADYAQYLAEFLEYFHTRHGVEFTVLSIQNEPDVKVYWPSCRWTGEELRDFIKVLGPILRERGLAPKLMLAEGSTWDQAWLKLEPALKDPGARQWIDIIGAHSYGWEDQVNHGRRLLRQASETHGIPIWMSEMSIIGIPDDLTMAAALRIAYYMYKDFVEANASAWIYCFTMYRPDFTGSMGVLSPAKDGKVVVPKRFWAFANYSRFVEAGWMRMGIEGLSFANSGFISPEGDRFVIVGHNAFPNGRPATYDFGDWRITSIKTYRTSAREDLAEVDGTQLEGTSFSATLAPFSVTTFSGTLERATRGAAGTR